MANPEHLKILKQGVEAWNRWREENPEVRPDFRVARLVDSRLRGANLADTDFTDAKLAGARLDRTNLSNANLRGADLNGARLDDARLDNALLDGVRLHHGDLAGAMLAASTLVGTDLTGASLFNANFIGANLYKANLGGARFAGTVFADTNVKQVYGLERTHHYGPSIVDGKTLARFEGNLPQIFLRGCGLSDWEIEAAKLHVPGLSTDEVTDITYEIHRLKTESPIQLNPLFISYSHADTDFSEALEKRFDEKHIRYWRDVHDMRAGRMETQIERAIRFNPIVLLILSERSVESDWVEWEASKARELEKELKRDVLCPIALDDAWKICDWPGPLRRQVEKYHILDFSEWQDSEVFEKMLARLIEGLGIFYPKTSGESDGQP